MNTKFILVIMCFSLFQVTHSAFAQNSATYFDAHKLENIEQYVVKGMKDERIPGVAIALIENGRIKFMKGFGVGDGLGTPVSPQTPFQLASITKGFSATLVLQLQNEGSLSLEDSVVSHIPWFSTDDKSQSDRITIRHLLQHNSGLSTKSGNLTQNNIYRGADATERSVKSLANTHLIAEPGTQYEYSNSNYQIVSHLVERLEGKPFESVMKERILEPLGMSNSYVQMPTKKTPKEANGHPQWFGFGVERPFVLGRMKMGDGGLTASVEDLSKYLLEVSTNRGGVVTQSMREQLHDSTQNNAGYGLGWQISDLDSGRLYHHGGTNGGFQNEFGYSPGDGTRGDIGFVILTNYSSALHTQFLWNLKRVIFDQEPLPYQLNTVNLYSLLVAFISVIALIYFLLRALRNSYAPKVTAKSLVAPCCLLIYSYSMAYLVPGMNKINLLSIYPFFPDLALALILCASLSFVLAMVLIVKRYQRIGA